MGHARGQGPGAPRRVRRRHGRPRGQRLRPVGDRARLRLRHGSAAPRRPTLREWTVVAEDKEIEVAPGITYPAWTYNGRIPGPDVPRDRGRPDADPLHQRLASTRTRSTSTASIPTSWTACPGIGEERGGGTIDTGEQFVYEFDAEPFGLHLYHCHVMPLAAHIAKGLYGAMIIDPKEPRPAGRRAGHGHERLRHQLRRRERDLRGQLDPVPLRQGADQGQARGAGADLPGEPARVRPDQLVPHPRQLLRLLPDRHPARAHRVHRHDHPGPGPARGSSSCGSPTPASFMFHAHKTEFAELGWLGFFEVEE